ncbi:MAG: hypothetical protein ABIV06_14295 [Thermoanaerobaculia bacterium]
MKIFISFAVFLLLIGGVVQAELLVEILGMPAEAYSFEPIYVLYSVTNRGGQPVLLPNGGLPREGALVYFAPKGGIPRYVSSVIGDRSFQVSATSLWLAPGESWLFYQNIGYEIRALDGEFDVQAVMSGDGQCGGELNGGKGSFPLQPHYLKTLSAGIARMKIFRCWEGDVRSATRSVRIRQPMAPIDQAARMNLLRRRKLRHNEDRTAWSMSAWDLYKTFPLSHYSYAALTRDESQLPSFKRAVEMQPENPLNPWVHGAMARRVLDYRSSCWEGQELPYKLEIEDLELPPGVREYLDRYAWSLEHWDCPRKVAKPRPSRP